MAEENKTPWQNGIWYSDTSRVAYVIVNGNEAKFMKMSCLDFPDSTPMMVGTWFYGEFGDAKPEVAKVSGKDKYNLEIDLTFMKIHAVLDANGAEIYHIGGDNKLQISRCLSDEEFEGVKDNRDAFDAPPNPYVTPRPGQVGKVIWISGKNMNDVDT